MSAPVPTGTAEQRARSLIAHPLARPIYGVLLVLVMLSPPIDQLADASHTIHYTQHAMFMVGGVLVGSGLVNRSSWSLAAAHRALALAVLGLVCELVMVLPWADNLAYRDPTFHQTQHGVIFLGGAFLGQAIVSLRQMRR